LGLIAMGQCGLFPDTSFDLSQARNKTWANLWDIVIRSTGSNIPQLYIPVVSMELNLMPLLTPDKCTFTALILLQIKRTG